MRGMIRLSRVSGCWRGMACMRGRSAVALHVVGGVIRRVVLGMILRWILMMFGVVRIHGMLTICHCSFSFKRWNSIPYFLSMGRSKTNRLVVLMKSCARSLTMVSAGNIAYGLHCVGFWRAGGGRLRTGQETRPKQVEEGVLRECPPGSSGDSCRRSGRSGLDAPSPDRNDIRHRL